MCIRDRPTASADLTCATGLTVSLAGYPNGSALKITRDGGTPVTTTFDGSTSVGPTGALSPGNHSVLVEVRSGHHGSFKTILDKPVTCATPANPQGSATLTCTQGWTVDLSGYTDNIGDAVVVRIDGTQVGTTGVISETGAYLGSGSTNLADGSHTCLLYISPSPRDRTRSRMPSSA